MTLDKTVVSETVRAEIMRNIDPTAFAVKVKDFFDQLDEGLMEAAGAEFEQLDEGVLDALRKTVGVVAVGAVGAGAAAVGGAASTLAGMSTAAVNFLSLPNLIATLGLYNPFAGGAAGGALSASLGSTAKIAGFSTAFTKTASSTALVTIGGYTLTNTVALALSGAAAGALTGYLAYKGFKYATRPKSVKLAEKIASLTKKRDLLLFDMQDNDPSKAERQANKFEKLTLEIQKLSGELEAELSRVDRAQEREELKAGQKGVTKDEVLKIVGIAKEGRLTLTNTKGGSAVVTREGVEGVEGEGDFT